MCNCTVFSCSFSLKFLIRNKSDEAGLFVEGLPPLKQTINGLYPIQSLLSILHSCAHNKYMETRKEKKRRRTLVECTMCLTAKPDVIFRLVRQWPWAEDGARIFPASLEGAKLI